MLTTSIHHAQRRHDLFTAILWIPAAVFMVLLAIGFSAYTPGAIPPPFVDVLLNFLALAACISIIGIPIGLWGRARELRRIEELSLRALHTPEESADFGPVLRVGGIRARVSTDGTLLLVRRIWPPAMRWLTNSALLASTFGLFGTVRFPTPWSITTIWMLTLLAGIIALPWMLANWVSVTRIRSTGLELHASSTDGPWTIGPIRWRTQRVPLPCFTSTGGGRMSITNGQRQAQIAALPESPYGQWQAIQLRRWLEEMLQVPLRNGE